MAMARRGRAIIPLLGAFTALGVVVAGVAIVLQMREHNARIQTEQELAMAKSENEELQQRLIELRTAKQQVEDALAKTKLELEESAQLVLQERQQKEGLAKAVDERQREIDRLGKDLEGLRSERSNLNDQIAKLRAQQQTLEQQVEEAEQAKVEAEDRIAQLTEQQAAVNLDTVVVQNEGEDTQSAPAATAQASTASASSAPAIKGQVIVVNREYDFVVMNLGKNQGLQIGQEFEVSRGSEVLGRVKVEKVYDELAAAAILPESNKAAIREGDQLKEI